MCNFLEKDIPTQNSARIKSFTLMKRDPVKDSCQNVKHWGSSDSEISPQTLVKGDQSYHMYSVNLMFNVASTYRDTDCIENLLSKTHMVLY